MLLVRDAAGRGVAFLSSRGIKEVSRFFTLFPTLMRNCLDSLAFITVCPLSSWITLIDSYSSGGLAFSSVDSR